MELISLFFHFLVDKWKRSKAANGEKIAVDINTTTISRSGEIDEKEISYVCSIFVEIAIAQKTI